MYGSSPRSQVASVTIAPSTFNVGTGGYQTTRSPASPGHYHAQPPLLAEAAYLPYREEHVEGSPVIVKDSAGRIYADRLFSILFLLFLCLLCYFAMQAALHGAPVKLYRPSNYNGLVCGYDSGVEKLPYLYYPLDPETSRPTLLQDAGVCLRRCPTVDDVKARATIPISRTITETDSSHTSAVLMEFSVLSLAYATITVSDAHCMPVDPTLRRMWHPKGQAQRRVDSGVLGRLGSVAKAKSHVLWFVGLAFALSIVYAQSLRFAGGLILLVAPYYVVFSLIALGSCYLIWGIQMQLENDWQKFPFTSADCTAGFAVSIILIVGALFTALTVYLQRHHLVAGVKSSSVMADVVSSMGSVFVTPVMTSLVDIVLSFTFLEVLFRLGSCGTPSGDLKSVGLSKNGGISYLPVIRYSQLPAWAYFGALLWTFGFFWIHEFLYSIGRFATSYAGTVWFFCEDTDSSERDPGGSPSLQGLQMALSYYSGSNALAAIWFGFVRPIKLAFFWAATRFEGDTNTEAEAISDYLGDARPCRGVVDLTSPTCYVETAIHSCNLFDAVQASAKNLSRHQYCPAKRLIGTVDFATAFGTTGIATTVALLSFSSLTSLREYSSVESPSFIGDPVAVSVIVGVLSASVVVHVVSIWATLSDAVLYSYVTESDRFMGSDPSLSQYAPYRLRALLSDMLKARGHVRGNYYHE